MKLFVIFLPLFFCLIASAQGNEITLKDKKGECTFSVEGVKSDSIPFATARSIKSLKAKGKCPFYVTVTILKKDPMEEKSYKLIMFNHESAEFSDDVLEQMRKLEAGETLIISVELKGTKKSGQLRFRIY